MKNKKNIFLLLFLISLALIQIQFISSEEVNYSINYLYDGIQISSLKYEPYPVNPGEYFDVWIQVELGSSVNYAKFELIEEFPFSLDENENATREYEDFSGAVIIHYKVRVSKDAVESENSLKIGISSNKYTTGDVIYELPISIENAQTDFDLVVQDSTTSEISLAIANIGKNTANSMIVRIPNQEYYRVTGTNGQMVGNLESGDYTIVSFSLTSIGKNSENPLIVQIDYTDSIGERRSSQKEVYINSLYSNINESQNSEIPENFPGNFSQDFPIRKKIKVWPYVLAGVLIIILIGFLIYSKFLKKKKSKIKKLSEMKNVKTNEIPDWMKKAKDKEINSSFKK
ncbi:MAG: CARDB domain-containing protein [Candidatus Pacearchaeota archaeon]|jgi:hypothetical protein